MYNEEPIKTVSEQLSEREDEFRREEEARQIAFLKQQLHTIQSDRELAERRAKIEKQHAEEAIELREIKKRQEMEEATNLMQARNEQAVLEMRTKLNQLSRELKDNERRRRLEEYLKNLKNAYQDSDMVRISDFAPD